MSELRILGKGGDLRISWNKENEDEVEAARETFDKKINEGWSAFAETRLGARGDKIKFFDSDAQRIVLIPPISGG